MPILALRQNGLVKMQGGLFVRIVHDIEAGATSHRMAQALDIVVKT